MDLRPFLLASLGLPMLIAQAPLPSAQEVLAKAKVAMGGAAWDRVTHLQWKGSLATSGLKGHLESLESLTDGRSTSSYDLGVAKGADGFDGKVSWSQDGTGDVRVEPVEHPAGMNYMKTYAFWFPKRCKAEIRHLGLREGHFHVLEIKPKGADTFELWVDGRTWLLDRTVTGLATQPETTFFQDYRDVSGLKLPFRIHTPKAEPAQDTRIEYSTITVNGPLPERAFARPQLNLADFGIEGGAPSATSPLEFIGDHLFVMARVNGQGPFRFFLDTGGVNVLTPSTAKALGLTSTGSVEGHGVGEKTESFGLTQVARVQVGEAWMKDQNFYVIPSLEGIGKMMGVDVAGVMGYELLRRFIAHVEYGPRRLTLSRPEGWRYEGKGAALPFTFNGHHPRVKGELDGIPGLFDIDTGSGSTLDVYAPFALEHKLKEKAAKAITTVTGHGAGGASGEEQPGLRGEQLQVLRRLARQGPLQGREEGHGPGDAAQQDLPGLQHHGLRMGLPEPGDGNGVAFLGLQAHLQDPALLAQPVRVLDGLPVGRDGRGLQLEAGADPLLPGALAPLLELLAQGALGDAHGRELVHGVAEGHHDALVPGQPVPLVAPEAVDEAQARVLPLPEGAGHEPHEEVRAVLQEGPEEGFGLRRHR